MDDNLTFDSVPKVLDSLNKRFEKFEQLLDSINSTITNQEQVDSNKRFNAKEAAVFLGISLATLYTKNSKGELPSCKPLDGKRLFFFEKDLIDYLKKGRRKTNSEIDSEAENHLKNKG